MIHSSSDGDVASSTPVDFDQAILDEISFAINAATSESLVRSDRAANFRCVELIMPQHSLQLLTAVCELLRKKLTSTSLHVIGLSLRLLDILLMNGSAMWFVVVNGDQKLLSEIILIARYHNRFDVGESVEVTQICVDISRRWNEQFTTCCDFYPNLAQVYVDLTKELNPYGQMSGRKDSRKSSPNTSNSSSRTNSPIPNRENHSDSNSVSRTTVSHTTTSSRPPSGRMQPVVPSVPLSMPLPSRATTQSSNSSVASSVSSGASSVSSSTHTTTSRSTNTRHGIPLPNGQPAGNHSGGGHHARSLPPTPQRLPQQMPWRSASPRTMGGQEAVQTLQQVCSILGEIFLSADIPDSLRKNELLFDIMNQISQLQKAMLIVIERAMDFPEVLEPLIAVNDISQTIVGLVQDTINFRCSMEQAKQQMSSALSTLPTTPVQLPLALQGQTCGGGGPSPPSPSPSLPRSRAPSPLHVPPVPVPASPSRTSYRNIGESSPVDFAAYGPPIHCNRSSTPNSARHPSRSSSPVMVPLPQGSHVVGQQSSGFFGGRPGSLRSPSPTPAHYGSGNMSGGGVHYVPAHAPGTYHSGGAIPFGAVLPPPPTMNIRFPVELPPQAAAAQENGSFGNGKYKKLLAKSESLSDENIITTAEDPFAPEALDALFDRPEKTPEEIQKANDRKSRRAQEFLAYTSGELSVESHESHSQQSTSPPSVASGSRLSNHSSGQGITGAFVPLPWMQPNSPQQSLPPQHYIAFDSNRHPMEHTSRDFTHRPSPPLPPLGGYASSPPGYGSPPIRYRENYAVPQPYPQQQPFMHSPPHRYQT